MKLPMIFSVKKVKYLNHLINLLDYLLLLFNTFYLLFSIKILISEHDRMITSTSDCCSSAGDLDGVSCCSCGLYAEAGDPNSQIISTVVSPPQSLSQSELLLKASTQN